MSSSSSNSLKRVAKTSSPPVEAKKPKLASIFLPIASSSKTTTKIDPSNFSRTEYFQSLSTVKPNNGTGQSEKELLTLECSVKEGLDESWLILLKDEIRKQYFLQLKQFLWNEGMRTPELTLKGKVYPAANDIYSWSRFSPIHKTKVLILGQDPYHGPSQAHGLCFSVQSPTRPPPSLKNIYKELKNEYSDFAIPSHGDLTPWAKSGVLLLNTCLTVKPSLAGSHSKKGWEEFTEKLIALVDRYAGAEEVGMNGKGIVVLAWGAWAEKKVKGLDKKKHLILTSAHPSPLSAHRGFLGNGHFKLANDWLEKRYGKDGGIDWTGL